MNVRSDDRVAALLDRFPGPLTLDPSRRKWLLVVAIGVVFILGAALLIRDPAGSSDTAVGRGVGGIVVTLGLARDRAAATTAIGWIALVIFALATIVGLLNLLPGAAGLTLGRDGFRTRNLFRRHDYKWADVSDIAGVRLPSLSRCVAFNDRLVQGSRLARTNVRLVGRNSALPDTYGLSVDDLAQLMSLWRERALAT
jgi:hypothetical protein